MELLKKVEDTIPEIFEQIKENILSEASIFKLPLSEENLEKIIKNQESLITDLLKGYPEFSKKIIERIENFYGKTDIPYIVLEANINLFKVKTLEYLNQEGLDNESIHSIKKFLDKFHNYVAKTFLKKEVSNLSSVQELSMEKYLLYKAHVEFIRSIISSIQTENLSSFPIESHKETKFYKYLHYPESLMVCMNSNLCSYIMDLYISSNRLSLSLYSALSSEDYIEAYRIFQIMSDDIMKLSRLLAELYFITFTDAETMFFKLIEKSELIKKRKYVFLIDIKNMKNLNRLYTTKRVNELLNIIHQELLNLIFSKKDKFLLIRGITANFYMLAVDVSPEEVSKITYEIKKKIEKSYKLNGSYVDINVTITALDIGEYLDLPKEDMLKMLLHLKEIAKKKNDGIYLVTDDEEKKTLRNWMEEKYKKVEFVRTKIDKEEIEVVFQPICDLQTQEIKAVETLARIKENNKLIPAGVFIDILYELNLITRLDEIVLRKITEKKDILKKVSKSIFINLSTESLMDKIFIEKLRDFVSKMREFNVVIELTEQRLLTDYKYIHLIEKEFEHFSIAIDDFGTGYSSLKLVSDFAQKGVLKVLKIDGSLIKEVDTKKYAKRVLKVIASMSKSLEITSVAEFVENENIYEEIKHLEIDLGQGYYFSEPKRAEEIVEVLEKSSLFS